MPVPWGPSTDSQHMGRDEKFTSSGSQRRDSPSSEHPGAAAGWPHCSCLSPLHGMPTVSGRQEISAEHGSGYVEPKRESRAPGAAINLQKAQLELHSNYLIPLPISPENILSVLRGLGRVRQKIDCILINNGWNAWLQGRSHGEPAAGSCTEQEGTAWRSQGGSGVALGPAPGWLPQDSWELPALPHPWARMLHSDWQC